MKGSSSPSRDPASFLSFQSRPVEEPPGRSPAQVGLEGRCRHQRAQLRGEQLGQLGELFRLGHRQNEASKAGKIFVLVIQVGERKLGLI